MRGILLACVLGCALVGGLPSKASARGEVQAVKASYQSPASPVYALQVQEPEKKIEVSVTNNTGGARWYRSPIWIAIAVIGGVVVLMLLVLVARGGGGTTVVRG